MECRFCGTAINNADGILGTGICLSSACRDRMNQAAAADAALKQAQADALRNLNSGSSSSLSPVWISVIALVVIALIVITVIIIKKRGK